MNWQRRRLWALSTVTIAVAAIVSFSSIRNLAEFAGFGWRSWLFPLLVDAVAAAGFEVWLTRSRAAKSGAWLGVFAVVLSLVANMTDWWITQQTVLAALLGAVPPAMLAALLLVMHRHHGGARPVEEVPEPFELAAIAAEGFAAPPATNGSAPRPVVVQHAVAPASAPGPKVTVGPGPQVRAEPARNGARGLDTAGLSAALAAPSVDDEAMVKRLLEADPQGEMSRRKVEALLGVGSFRAGKYMQAAQELRERRES